MRVVRSAALMVSLAVLVLGVSASVALASVTIHENKGVGKARLGMKDATAKRYLGRVLAKWTDNNYATPSYGYGFRKRLGNHHYALEMYSNSSHKVFEFVCNRAYYVTSKGVKVGSKTAYLKSKYPTGLKRHPAGLYWRYTYGKKHFTDFYVKKSTGRVFEIIVRSK